MSQETAELNKSLEKNNLENKVSEHEFIQRINAVYDKCTGHETYGNTVEFFDEDGVVLMRAISIENSNSINFEFSEDSEDFNFKTLDVDENNVVN